MGCEVHFAPSKYNDPEFVNQLSLEEIEKILDATGSLNYSPSEIESEVLPNGNVRIVIPMALRRVKHRHVIVAPESEGAVIEKSPVLIAIANGFLWQKMLDERKVASIDELAKNVGKERAVVSHTLQLTLLSPEIIHMALTGTLPPSVNMKSLKAALPSEWENQREFLGIA